MKTIIFIGMMGSGKTTIGKLLGEKLNLQSIDIDCEIEKIENRKISEIFKTEGEKYFRAIEKNAIKTNFSNKNKVISLGGGAFEDVETQKLLIENSVIIYLKTSPSVIFDRIKNNTDRPLLNNQMNIEKITEIIKNRQQNYEKSHITILTDNKNPNTIVEEILGVLKCYK